MSRGDVSWTRRLFVRESLKGWLGLVLGPTIYATARGLVAARSHVRALPKDIGAAETLLPGTSKIVPFGNERVLVVRDRDKKLHAVSGVCTHMGCSVRFEADPPDGQLMCNCHESKFNLRGENLKGPATRALTSYHVENVGGRLILEEDREAPGNL